MRHLAALLLAATLAACGRPDPVATDLVALNAAGQAAMARADVQQAMAKVQAAGAPAEKAAILRESAAAIGAARDALGRAELASPEVRALQSRMVAGFGQLGDGARSAATAFEASAPDDLAKARQQMRDGQVAFIAAGQEMVQLAKQRQVDLGAAARP